jgi:hypothetical protein
MKLVKWPTKAEHGQHTYHWCPACEKLHVLPDSWSRSGPDEAPSYSPSFLQYDARPEGNCHYIITAGVIQFCPDSWHKRGDAVPMPEIPETVLAKLTEEVFR